MTYPDNTYDGSFNEVISSLEVWYDSHEITIDKKNLSKIRTFVTDAVVTQNYERLKQLHRRLTPLAYSISENLAKKNALPPWAFQVTQAPVLAAVTRIAMHYLTRISPEIALQHIRHGEVILKIMRNLLLEKTDNQKNSVYFLNLNEIRDEICKRSSIKKTISTSTISRSVRALEEADFIHCTGATRNRKFKFLNKALTWCEQHTRSDLPDTVKHNTAADDYGCDMKKVSTMRVAI